MAKKNSLFEKKKKSISLINRIIEENLLIFLKNSNNLEKIKEKIIENKVIENNEIVFSTKYNFYTQNSIDKYNNQIAKINYWINQYNQKRK